MTGLLGSDQILRIESLGDNCELGFVLRRLSCETGSLLRWASVQPKALLAMLRANFAGTYEFRNLEPLRHDMVTDTRYGVGWHSALKSEPVGGKLGFVDDELKRRKIHADEARKIRYLISKFTARAKLGGLIFVIKANDGIGKDVIDEIFEAVSAVADNARIALMEMQASDDPALIGTVAQQRPGLLRGYVSRFAPYAEANAVDMNAWTAVLDAALGLFACPDWSKRIANLRTADATIDLAFPLGKAQDLSQPILGDLRAGAASLLRGNTWCRQVNDSFRLHGAPPGHLGTVLRWTAVRTPGTCQLCGDLQCPVDDSLPVEVAVTIRDQDDAVMAEWKTTVAPHRPSEIALDFTPRSDQSVTIEMTVHASRELKSGERAVIDVSPLSLHLAAEPAATAEADGQDGVKLATAR